MSRNKSNDSSLNKLVVMRDYSTGLSNCIFCLLHNGVWCALRICHDDGLLRRNSSHSQDKKGNKQVAEE